MLSKIDAAHHYAMVRWQEGVFFLSAFRSGGIAVSPGTDRVRSVPATRRPALSARRDRRGVQVRRDRAEDRQRGDRCRSRGPVASRSVPTSFFEPAGPGRFRATQATAGPWSADAQHGGPPSALAARELERHEPVDGMRLARVAVDILRPVPVAALAARTRTVRAGKRIALLETVLEASGQ